MGAKKLDELLEQIPKLKEEELAQVVSLVDKFTQQRKVDYLKAIEAGLGKFKGKLSTVDEFLANKQIEKLKED